MTTIGRLARRFGLSRSTLLYYDSIGLLSPCSRTANGYRLYSDEDAERLKTICRYRGAGITLENIKRVLDSASERLVGILEQRLTDLNGEIHGLQEQQRMIVGLLEKQGHLSQAAIMNRERWISLLASSGFGEKEMQQWHARFERSAPGKHREFLELLCLSDQEIISVRESSRAWGRGLEQVVGG